MAVKEQRDVLVGRNGSLVFAGVRIFSEEGANLLVQDGAIRVTEGQVVISWEDPAMGRQPMGWLNSTPMFCKGAREFRIKEEENACLREEIAAVKRTSAARREALCASGSRSILGADLDALRPREG